MNFRFKKAELGVFATKVSDDVLKNFSKDCRILGLTRGQFSLIDLLRSVLKKTGDAHVICTTWSAGIKDAHQVEWLMRDNKVKTFNLITDHSYSTRQRKYAVTIEELFGKENIRTSEIHAKFLLIHNEEYKVCIRTSMNLNANKTCENFELDEGEDLFNFYMDFVEGIFGNMPKGFTSSSFKANKALDLFFNKTKISGWSDL